MKKLFSVVALAIALHLAVSNKVVAQSETSYKNAIGMRMEFGSNYGTLVGVSGKHFFNAKSAGEAQVLFGSLMTMISAEYQYHGDIPNAAGLKWVAGIGGGVALAKKYSGYDYYWGHYSSGGGSDFLIRPVAGLDYKVDKVPLNFTFDWRPAFVVTHGTSFNAARFGLGVRYAL